MSINYYFRNTQRYAEIQKEEDILNKKIDNVMEYIKNNLTDNKRILSNLKYKMENKCNDIEYNSEIHIGQNAGDYVTLLREQPYYNTVSEMKEFYLNNKDKYIIIDEYDRKLTWEELEKNIVKLGQGILRGEYDDDGFCWVDYEFC